MGSTKVLGQIGEEGGEQHPKFLHRGDARAFILRMSLLNVRTKGDHVEIGITPRNDTTLQSRMAGTDLCLLAKEVTIHTPHPPQNGGVGSRAPAWIAALMPHLRPQQMKRSRKGGGDSVFA